MINMEFTRIIKASLGSLLGGFIFFIALPYLFIELGNYFGLQTNPTTAGSILSMIFIVAGIGIYFYSFYLFVKEGKGTPVPFEPTQYIVTSGIYKYSRNPVYLGYILVIFGITLLTGALMILLYAGIAGLFIYFYVRYYEEPLLEEKFEEAYRDYKKRVPRWL